MNRRFIPLIFLFVIFWHSAECIMIGIAGGSGSGKTTVAELIAAEFEPGEVVIISQDSYYKHHPEMTLEERRKINFDHPDSIDFDLMLEQLTLLQAGYTISQPVYDFVTSLRLPKAREVSSAPIIIVEGILLFTQPAMMDQFDLKLFVETYDDIRFIRRLMRDVEERGRSLRSVVRQYLSTVRPMHRKYVKPSKEKADLIIPWNQNDEAVLNAIRPVILYLSQARSM